MTRNSLLRLGAAVVLFAVIGNSESEHDFDRRLLKAGRDPFDHNYRKLG